MARIKAGAVLDVGNRELSLNADEKEIVKEEVASAKASIISKIMSNDEVSASDIIGAIFPHQYADIFISHSHRDIDFAKKVSNVLEEKGYSCFIDSLVWGSSEEVLKCIDKIYCYHPESGMYDYDKRNSSTAHVHMMLTSALQQMISSSTYFLFLKSDHSIKFENLVSAEKTYSPWIHMELNFSSLVMPRTIVANESVSKDSRSVPVHHDAYTDHLLERD